MKEKEKIIDFIIEKFKGQPDFIMKSIEWFVDNLHLVRRLFEKDTALSEAHLQEEISKAIKKQDYACYALLMYQKVVQEQEKAENEK